MFFTSLIVLQRLLACTFFGDISGVNVPDENEQVIHNLVDKIFDGRHIEATSIWKEIQFPSSSNDSFFANEWMKEILHHGRFNLNSTPEGTENIGIFRFYEETAEFVYSSVNLENKFDSYVQIWNNAFEENGMETDHAMNSTAEWDLAFRIGKLLLIDGLKTSFIPPLSKAMLSGRKAFLQNVASKGFLYVGEANGSRKVLLWKSSKLINPTQAEFSFRLVEPMKPTAPKFKILTNFQVGSGQKGFQITTKNSAELNNGTVLIDTKPVNDDATNAWKVELLPNSDLYLVKDELDVRHFVCSSFSEDDQIDSKRSQAVIFTAPANSNSIPELCKWSSIFL